MKKNQFGTKLVVLMGLFIAMSVIGAYIKIPNAVTGSIAFDSFPAFVGALILGGIPGAIIAFLGHMVSAAITGFPMTLPIHLFIGFQMAIIMFVFSFAAKRTNIIVASVIAIILNGVVAPACFILIPNMGMPVFIAILLPLLVASVANVLAAVLIYRTIINTSVVKKLQDI